MLTRNTIRLLRIPFSLFLMPVFLLAISQAPQLNVLHTGISFFIIHLLVYPASNGYNSYIDKDQSSIGGLENPPLPTRELFYTTLFMDALAIACSALFISLNFSLAILLYILASRAYSSPQIRLKKYALLGFLVVVIFQGAFTYFMSTIAISDDSFNFHNQAYVLIAASLQIAGAYPLTQVYQHKQDAADGVNTISMKLGIKGTFIFTACLFALCNLFYFLHFTSHNQINHFYLLQIFFIPVIIYFTYWFIKISKDQTQANFKNTMLMNKLASICMSAFFVLLIFFNHIL